MMRRDLPIHTVEHGMFVREHDGGEPTLLFLHGLGSWGECFAPVLHHPLLRRWRRLVPDLPGHGRTAWTPEPVPLRAVAERLAGWIRGRPSEPVVVVGHSFGGVVAQLLAARAPTSVRALVDVEGNVSMVDCTISERVAAQTVEDFCSHGFDALRDAIYRAGLEDPILRDYYASLRFCDPRAFHDHAVELIELSAAEGLARHLAGLAMPVRYVAGAPGGTGARSLALLAEAGVPCTVISPAGHVPFADRPDDFVQMLIAMVES